MKRVGIYARYSTDLQRDASIEDQIRVCRDRLDREGWRLANCYTDFALSGATMMRPGLQALLADVAAGELDVVLSEAMDRLSRDQADIAGIFKRLQFAGVDLVTLSEGLVSDLHVGLTGTMNALQLKEIARKVRRGMRGRIAAGRSAGGLPYGYEVVPRIGADGQPIRGERRIRPDQAAIVRRICEEYVAGSGPKTIARRLNAEGVPGPAGKGWNQSTINGNRRRGIGILSNEIYAGTLVWNRIRMVKDPETGKRVSRVNPEEEWIRQDVPELRIVPEEVWQAVKDRQRALPDREEWWRAKRPRYLLSGLLKCGSCGAGFSIQNHTRYGCAGTVRGTCDNRLKIGRAELEAAVLRALHSNLMDPQLVAIFCAEYVRHANRLRQESNAARSAHQAELQRLVARHDRAIEAVVDGTLAKAEAAAVLDPIRTRRAELERILAGTEEAPVLLHPNMSERYRQEVERLTEALSDGSAAQQAIAALRALIDRITLTPNAAGDALVVDLHGDLAGILAIAANGGKPLPPHDPALSVKLVAEEGLEPPTRGL